MITKRLSSKPLQNKQKPSMNDIGIRNTMVSCYIRRYVWNGVMLRRGASDKSQYGGV